MLDKEKMVSDDNLEEVSGGRRIRMNERKNQDNVYREFMRYLDRAAPKDVGPKYRAAYEKALIKWTRDINNAPEDSADILFSDYFDPDKVFNDLLDESFMNRNN